MSSEDRKPELLKVDGKDDRFKYITNCLMESSQRREAVMILNFSEQGRMMATTNIGDPSILIGPITELLNQTTEIARTEGKNHEFNPGDVVCYSLVMAVQNHFQDLHLKEKWLKYQDFKKGNIEDLSEKEMDEFIDMKLREDSSKEYVDVDLWYKELSDEYSLTCNNASLLMALSNDLKYYNHTLDVIGESCIIRYPKHRTSFDIHEVRELLNTDPEYKSVKLRYLDNEGSDNINSDTK